MYDVDGNGTIEPEEMSRIVHSIYAMMGPDQAGVDILQTRIINGIKYLFRKNMKTSHLFHILSAKIQTLLQYFLAKFSPLDSGRHRERSREPRAEVREHLQKNGYQQRRPGREEGVCEVLHGGQEAHRSPHSTGSGLGHKRKKVLASVFYHMYLASNDGSRNILVNKEWWELGIPTMHKEI